MLRRHISIFALLILTAVARADTLTVLVDHSGEYPTIQDAINAAAQGDTILIGPGNYTWSNQNIDQWPDPFRGMIQLLNESADDPRAGTANDIVILGEAGPAETSIDAQRRGRVFYSSGRQQGDDNVAMRFTVEGISLINGLPQGGGQTNQWGGGSATHLSSPTFRNCRFLNNESEQGGASWVGGQNKALFEDCVFRDNIAKYGGGVLVVNSTRNNSVFRNCRFESNVASQTGGGIYVVNAQVEIEACSFILNEGLVRASAIATNLADPLIIRDCFIVGNVGDTSTFWGYHYISPEASGDPLPEVTTIEMTNTLLANNAPIGVLFEEGVAATVSCTDSYGHNLGNWRDQAAQFVGVDGNGSFDPKLCGNSLRLRQVCDASSVLGVNNSECAGDMGLAVANCSGCATTEVNTQVFYPNPFRDTATLNYELDGPGHVRITVYDMRGRAVRSLVDEAKAPGPYQIAWDGCDDDGSTVASGVYFCEFQAGDIHSRTPLILLH
jgi:predicted outer membrane repeat protein